MTKKITSHEYDHIDFRINVLYDAMYNKASTSHYILKPIIKHNISLIDIKEPSSFDYSHIFEGSTIKFTGKRNNKWEFKRTSESSHPSTLLVGKYYGSGNTNDMGRKELYNPAMHYMLSELALNENFKHSLLPLMFFDISPKDLKVKSEIMYSIIKDDINDNTRLFIFATEHYFKTESLKDYIKNEFEIITMKHWKVLLFQIFYSLFKISERFQKYVYYCAQKIEK